MGKRRLNRDPRRRGPISIILGEKRKEMRGRTEVKHAGQTLVPMEDGDGFVENWQRLVNAKQRLRENQERVFRGKVGEKDRRQDQSKPSGGK